MKTKLISTLKKELLIVELPKWYKSFNYQKPLLEVRGDEPNLVEFLSLGRYEILGKPDEIKEEDARELVEETFVISKSGGICGGYKNGDKITTATESLLSALESEIYWDVNPYLYPSPYDPRSKTGRFEHGEELEKAEKNYNEAQEKTFDKKRTLIFVKN